MFILWLVLVILCICLLALYLYHRHIMTKLDKMLDSAIQGDFTPASFDERQFSKIEFKLSRFITAGKLKGTKVMEEQALVRKLIGDISHQTKTPIANILLYTQLLQEQEELSLNSKEFATEIAQGAEKLNFLVQALVKTSRLESGIIKVKPEPCNLENLAQNAVSQVQAKAEEKKVLFSVLQPEQPVYALADFKWCTEAVYNILDNAVKYTPSGGKVTIQFTNYEMFARIDITDTGEGISEENLPLVFGRFWRGSNFLQTEGVGIGLYLSREIIISCGGYIKAKANPKGGTVFSVFLPTKAVTTNLSEL